MIQKLLRRFYLRQSRKTFLLYSMVAFGVPFSLWLLWGRIGRGGLLYYAYIVAIGLACSVLWGYIVWELYAKHVIRRMSEKLEGGSSTASDTSKES